MKPDSVDSLNVDWVSGEISITPYDGSDIIITEYARRQLNEDEKLSYGVTGGTLNIRYISTPMTFNMMLTKKLEVFVPESIAEKLDVLYVNSTSAELTVSDLTVRALEIHETSGDSSILNIAADTVNVQSVSGEIDITSLDASKMTMGSVSGTITLTGVTADTVKSGTTSGEQDFEGTFTSLALSSVSGEIDVRRRSTPRIVRPYIRHIRINLPEMPSYWFSVATESAPIRGGHVHRRRRGFVSFNSVSATSAS